MEAAPPPLTGVSAGVVSVQVYGEEEDEDEAEKEERSGTLEIKSEPEEPAVEKSSDHITATAALSNSSSSEKRKASASEGVDEVHLKKKKLLDVVLKSMMEKKAGVVEGSKEVNKSAISEAKKSKSKHRTSDISNIAAKTFKEDVAAAAGETAGQGRRKSISSTGELAMIRVMNGAGQKAKNTESVKKVKNATKQMLAKPSNSSTLVPDDEGNAGTEASRKKSEVQSISKSPKAVKIKPQIASPKAHKKILKKAQQAAVPKVLMSKEGATPSGKSLKDANQVNADALTISTLPQAVNLHSKTNEVSETSAGNPPAAPAVPD